MFHEEIEIYVSENHRAAEAIQLPLKLGITICMPHTT